MKEIMEGDNKQTNWNPHLKLNYLEHFQTPV